MTEEPRPFVNMPMERVMCSRHGEPFRSDWPAGYLPFALELFSAFTADAKVVEWAHGDAHRLDLAVAEFGPMCCYVSRRALLKAYRASKVGTNAVCSGCNRWGRGAPYKYLDPRTGEEAEHPHLCFECVCDRMVDA